MTEESVQTWKVPTLAPDRSLVRDVQNSIRQSLHCESRHLSSTFVEERGPDGTMWCGDVETFELVGHPQAQRCFAWSYTEEGRSRHVIVLEEPPVVGPASAVLSTL